MEGPPPSPTSTLVTDDANEVVSWQGDGIDGVGGGDSPVPATTAALAAKSSPRTARVPKAAPVTPAAVTAAGVPAATPAASAAAAPPIDASAEPAAAAVDCKLPPAAAVATAPTAPTAPAVPAVPTAPAAPAGAAVVPALHTAAAARLSSSPMSDGTSGDLASCIQSDYYNASSHLTPLTARAPPVVAPTAPLPQRVWGGSAAVAVGFEATAAVASLPRPEGAASSGSDELVGSALAAAAEPLAPQAAAEVAGPAGAQQTGTAGASWSGAGGASALHCCGAHVRGRGRGVRACGMCPTPTPTPTPGSHTRPPCVLVQNCTPTPSDASETTGAISGGPLRSGFRVVGRHTQHSPSDAADTDSVASSAEVQRLVSLELQRARADAPGAATAADAATDGAVHKERSSMRRSRSGRASGSSSRHGSGSGSGRASGSGSGRASGSGSGSGRGSGSKKSGGSAARKEHRSSRSGSTRDSGSAATASDANPDAAAPGSKESSSSSRGSSSHKHREGGISKAHGRRGDPGSPRSRDVSDLSTPPPAPATPASIEAPGNGTTSIRRDTPHVRRREGRSKEPRGEQRGHGSSARGSTSESPSREAASARERTKGDHGHRSSGGHGHRSSGGHSKHRDGTPPDKPEDENPKARKARESSRGTRRKPEDENPKSQRRERAAGSGGGAAGDDSGLTRSATRTASERRRGGRATPHVKLVSGGDRKDAVNKRGAPASVPAPASHTSRQAARRGGPGKARRTTGDRSSDGSEDSSSDDGSGSESEDGTSSDGESASSVASASGSGSDSGSDSSSDSDSASVSSGEERRRQRHKARSARGAKKSADADTGLRAFFRRTFRL